MIQVQVFNLLSLRACVTVLSVEVSRHNLYWGCLQWSQWGTYEPRWQFLATCVCTRSTKHSTCDSIKINNQQFPQRMFGKQLLHLCILVRKYPWVALSRSRRQCPVHLLLCGKDVAWEPLVLCITNLLMMPLSEQDLQTGKMLSRDLTSIKAHSVIMMLLTNCRFLAKLGMLENYR